MLHNRHESVMSNVRSRKGFFSHSCLLLVLFVALSSFILLTTPSSVSAQAFDTAINDNNGVTQAFDTVINDNNGVTGQPKNTATNSTVTINVNISTPTTGKYGPENVAVYKIPSLTDTNSRTNIGTTSTNEVTLAIARDLGTFTILTAKINGVAPGFYIACLEFDSTKCSPAFEKIDGKDPSIMLGADTKAQEDINTPNATDPTTTDTKKEKTCSSEVSGLGWIICPVIKAVSALNDTMWGLTSKLLMVNPISQSKTASGDSSSGIFLAWGVIRNLANVVFVIVFLIVIFSTLSSFGISNYGVKKMLPKLIISAILVNVSFVIIQLAVDSANILGVGIYNLIVSIDPGFQSLKFSWEHLVESVTAGTITLVVGSAAVGVAGGLGATFFMILPTILIASLAVLVAMLTLIFRQAAIPILAILAPLALVASLLPNTESWYKKWKDLLIKMLMLYPLAAVVFAGSKFAAAVIIGDGLDFWNYLVGLVVLAMPLFSLPFLAKSGGDLMSKVNGSLGKLASNLEKPIRSWSKSREDEKRAEYLAGSPSGGVRGMPQRLAQRQAFNKKRRETNTDAAKKEFESKFMQSDNKKDMEAVDRSINAEVKLNFDKLDVSTKNLQSAIGRNLNKALIDAKTQNDTQRTMINTEESQSMRGGRANYNLGIAKKEARTEELRTSTILESRAPLKTRLEEKLAEQDLKSAQTTTSRFATEATVGSLADRTARLTAEGIDQSAATRLATGLRGSQRETTVETLRSNSASNMAKQELYADILNPTTGPTLTRDIAGVDPYGAQRAQAIATSEIAKMRAENVTGAKTLLESKKYSGAQLTTVVTGTLADGGVANLDQREAAMQMVVASGDFESIKTVNDHLASLPATTDEEKAIRTQLQQSFGKLQSQTGLKSFNGTTQDAFMTGNMSTSFDDLNLGLMSSGKLTPSSWTELNPGEIRNMNNPALLARMTATQLTDMFNSIDRALTSPDINKLLGASRINDLNALMLSIVAAPAAPPTPPTP